MEMFYFFFIQIGYFADYPTGLDLRVALAY